MANNLNNMPILFKRGIKSRMGFNLISNRGKLYEESIDNFIF